MTPTELKFYRELKKVTDKLELSIFPEVNMERIISICCIEIVPSI